MSREPNAEFLIQLAAALREAEHRNAAEHLAAGFLCSLYPDWFDKYFGNRPKIESVLKAEYKKTFGSPTAVQRKDEVR